MSWGSIATTIRENGSAADELVRMTLTLERLEGALADRRQHLIDRLTGNIADLSDVDLETMAAELDKEERHAAFERYVFTSHCHEEGSAGE